jgi:phosphoribosyl 1,2-cyclic phosphate phosphodiesterase
MYVKIQILGSGTSTGVPVIACNCPVCTSTEPKNKRTRASVAISEGDRLILVDTSPEMRLQVLGAGIKALDAVLYTHLHADHSAGFDDLRAFFFRSRGPIDLYMLPQYIPEMRTRFSYAFENTGYQGAVPSVTLHPIPESSFTVAGFDIEPVRLAHGHVETCGFRFGRFLYATDFKRFPDFIVEKWRGKIDVMVASGIHFGTHQAHSVIPETLALFEALGVKRGIISHLAHDVDYAKHSALLPAHVEFAFDGMTIDLKGLVT